MRSFMLLGAWLNVLGDILLKRWASGKLWIGWGMLAYVVDALVWAAVLKSGGTLSKTLVIWEVIIVATGVLWGVLVEQEHVSPVSALGVLIALFGVVLVHVGE